MPNTWPKAKHHCASSFFQGWPGVRNGRNRPGRLYIGLRPGLRGTATANSRVRGRQLGSRPTTFLTEQLVGQFKSPLTPNFNDCGTALRLGATCSFQANVNDQGTAPNQAASCKVVILEAKTNVRGTMVALDPAHGRPLSQTDLR